MFRFLGVAVPLSYGISGKGLARGRADKRAWTRRCGRWRGKKGRWVSDEIPPAGGIRTFIKPQAKKKPNKQNKTGERMVLVSLVLWRATKPNLPLSVRRL